MNEKNGAIRDASVLGVPHVRYVRCNHSRTDFSKQLLW